MPLLSCILATKDRPHFLAQAIRYYQQQTLTDTELIIIDDGVDSCEALVPSSPQIKYLRLPRATSLGTKLNLGIEASSGHVIQKLDDDDYYHPRFLEVMTSGLLGARRSEVICGVERLLVLISATGALVDAGSGWFAGGTYCFYKDVWKQAPFRDVPRRVDVFFLEDHPDLVKLPVSVPELYVLVRHDKHTWTRMAPETVQPFTGVPVEDVTEYFMSCPPYGKSLRDLIPAEHAAFYQSLQR
ncbi:glycosyltransferase family 2 protein [Streptomyces sp. NBC_00691]|uniref:glycosyltransferase family 2 protein n=1 Tax=Streptomyces sp. NBC_00691 TaxID=2903671 RepID=UPI002E379066|nr:glycosyltransferase [Streptomyces sp. NBC_00691]